MTSRPILSVIGPKTAAPTKIPTRAAAPIALSMNTLRCRSSVIPATATLTMLST